jgi:hypothetical protein
MLTMDNMKMLISLAGLQVKPVMKVVMFYEKPIGISGFDIYEDGVNIVTYAVIDGETRAIYHDNEEYTHTTYSDLPCTFDTIVKVAARRAAAKITDELTSR